MPTKLPLFALYLGMVFISDAGSARADEAMDARHVIDAATITVERVRTEHKPAEQLSDLLGRARGVLVVPAYYKAGFIIGGSYGDGVLLKRQRDGSFGDPAFYRMTSGSIGLQAGMQSAEIMFMILTDNGMQAVLEDEFKIGANVGISIGAVGAGAEAATTTNVGNDIVAYSLNAGLFAGGSFEGSIIKPRRDWNAAVYGVGQDKPPFIVERNQLIYADDLKRSLVAQMLPATQKID
jgi:lipid-binding SYLF domain-containing protein